MRRSSDWHELGGEQRRGGEPQHRCWRDLTGGSGSAESSAGAASGGSGSVGVAPAGDAGSHVGRVVGDAVPSAGCGRPWTEVLGRWVSQPAGCGQGAGNQGTPGCQAIPPGSIVPVVATRGSAENRGWWVYVPNGYDPNKPYKVIYNGAGCGGGNFFNAGEDVYPYDTVDDGQAILVGLDYDTYSDVPGCYDDRDPQSNDFAFFPWLQSEIESALCVDTSHEFFSGYSAGAWLAQQLDCAFPEKLRGFVANSGCEPGAPGYPGAQYSPCVDKPTAALYVHDFGDQDNTYACILPACARVLEQNGCGVTRCDPLDTSITTPYSPPAGVTLPPGTACVQFNGCPAEYPVVFCVTHNQAMGNGQNWGVVNLFWDFMNRQAPVPPCPTGSGYAAGVCMPCPAGGAVCDDVCGVDLLGDANNCGACGNACPSGASCVGGVCSCPKGDTVCGGACVDANTNPNSCGACGNFCPFGGSCAGGSCSCPSGDAVCSGACADETTDANNCGACGSVCPSGGSCVAGVCACPSGDAVCNGVCVNERTDTNNCGACGDLCPTGAPCQLGTCLCPAGEAVCSQLCVNEHTDMGNCGMCGNACPAGGTCVAGACACPAGAVACDGVCADEETDSRHCGACATVCPVGARCQAGACVCPSDDTTCAGVCVDEQSDPNFCGSCDNSCPGSAPFCRAGVCSAN